MSNFGAKVYEALSRAGRNAAWLSDQTGISRVAISEWKTDPNRIPKPSSVRLVAKALEGFVTFEELAEAAGYSLMRSSSVDEREQRLLEFMRSQPRAPRVWDMMQRLTPDEQDEVLSLIEAWTLTRRRRSPGGS